MCARKEAIGAMTQKSQIAAEGLGTRQLIFFCTPGADLVLDNNLVLSRFEAAGRSDFYQKDLFSSKNN